MLDGAAWVDLLQVTPGGSEPCAAQGIWFHLGDVCLELASESGAFLDAFLAQWADCRIGEPVAGLPTICCSARAPDGASLLLLSFTGKDLPDPLDATTTPVRMLRHLSRYAQRSGPAAGWRMFVDRDNRMLAAGSRCQLVIDLDEAPPDFAIDALIGIVQSAQPGLLFLHAASFGIGGVGALLIGAGQAGKSTTILALGARGHAILGDDVAAIRIRSGELLPFRKALSLRPGPYVSSFGARLRAIPHACVVGPDGKARTLVRIGTIFPAAQNDALPLRFAFLLGGFSAGPGLIPYRPDIGSVARLKDVVSESVPAWGLSPGRDLMKFLNVVGVLSKLACHRIVLGPPEASAAAIESMMEATCSST
jgi:hypothetical protein